MLRERSPTPEPSGNAGAEVFGIDSAAPARGRQKSRRGRGYALVLRERSPTPEPSINAVAWFGSTGVHRPGGGKSRVAGEDTPHAPRAFADPRAFDQRCCMVWVNWCAPARGRQKSRRDSASGVCPNSPELPVPSRRTFAPTILAFRSLGGNFASPSWLRSVSYAARLARATPPPLASARCLTDCCSSH